MFLVVSYDIVDDKRRNRVSKTMKRYGDRVQRSVFEANMEHDEYRQMLAKLRRLIEYDEDSIRIYRMCAGCKQDIEILGLGVVSEDPQLVII